MQLRHFYLLTTLLVFCFSCNTEIEPSIFKSRIKNESTSVLNVEGFDLNSELVFQAVLDQGDSSDNCELSSEAFTGLSCRITFITFRFSNDKGYICNVGSTNTNQSYCFGPDRSPIGGGDGSTFNDLGNNTFEFVVTQEDFENAFDLPE